MERDDWVSLAEYDDSQSAQVVSGRLTLEGIPNRVVIDTWRRGYVRAGPCFIWVPPTSLNAAKAVLGGPFGPEAELTDLALKYPPPDDA